MSYTPTTWATGDVVIAAKMNNIEQGIKGLETSVATIVSVPSHQSSDLGKTLSLVQSSQPSSNTVLISEQELYTGNDYLDYLDTTGLDFSSLRIGDPVTITVNDASYNGCVCYDLTHDCISISSDNGDYSINIDSTSNYYGGFIGPAQNTAYTVSVTKPVYSTEVGWDSNKGIVLMFPVEETESDSSFDYYNEIHGYTWIDVVDAMRSGKIVSTMNWWDTGATFEPIQRCSWTDDTIPSYNYNVSNLTGDYVLYSARPNGVLKTISSNGTTPK